MVEGIFIFLYPMVFLTSMAGYVPQIVNLLRVRTAAESMALSSWYIWLSASLISFGYGVTALHDFMFSMVAGFNALAQSVIIALVLYRRGQISLALNTPVLSVAPEGYIQAAPAE